MTIFENFLTAVTVAQARPVGTIIGYVQGWGWSLYHATAPVDGVTPELLAVGPGKLPFPLSEFGAEVLASAVRAKCI